MMTKAMKHLFRSALTAAGLAACTPYNSEFTCPLNEGGIACASARQVYELTNAAAPAASAPVSPTTAEATPPPAAAFAGVDSEPISPGATAAPAAAGPATAGGVWPVAVTSSAYGPAALLPLRTPAQVIRVWIAPWEDSGGNLILSGYVYSEVAPRRWQVGNTAVGTGVPQLAPVPFATRQAARPAPPLREAATPPRPAPPSDEDEQRLRSAALPARQR